MEEDKPQSLMCAIVAVDPTNDFSYLVCSVCEKPLPFPNSLCNFCKNNAFRPGSFSSKRLFRLLMSIASDTKVFRVICFDRVAKVLIGCSADEFFNFAKLHPFAATNVGKILEGQLFRMTLSKPKNGYAEHLRVVSVIPLSSGFQPAIQSLKQLYGVAASQVRLVHSMLMLICIPHVSFICSSPRQPRQSPTIPSCKPWITWSNKHNVCVEDSNSCLWTLAHSYQECSLDRSSGNVECHLISRLSLILALVRLNGKADRRGHERPP